MSEHLDILFDGPPSHESGRFVDVVDADGKGVKIGEWMQAPDGAMWALRIPDPRPAPVTTLGEARKTLADAINTLRDAGFECWDWQGSICIANPDGQTEVELADPDARPDVTPRGAGGP